MIFVVNASAYDIIDDAEDTNGLSSSLQVFGDLSQYAHVLKCAMPLIPLPSRGLIRSRWFRFTSFIVLFTHMDMLKDKLKRVPLSVCPDFDDVKSSDYDECKECIESKFDQRINPADHAYQCTIFFQY